MSDTTLFAVISCSSWTVTALYSSVVPSEWYRLCHWWLSYLVNDTISVTDDCFSSWTTPPISLMTVVPREPHHLCHWWLLYPVNHTTSVTDDCCSWWMTPPLPRRERRWLGTEWPTSKGWVSWTLRHGDRYSPPTSAGWGCTRQSLETWWGGVTQSTTKPWWTSWRKQSGMPRPG